jgi:hypothetical protein
MSGRRRAGQEWQSDAEKAQRKRAAAQLWRLVDAWRDAGEAVRAEFMNQACLRPIEEPATTPEAPGT